MICYTRNTPFWVLSSFLVFITIHGCAPSGNDLESAKRSVIKIFTFDESGQPLGTGTGFYINDSTVMTNHHVISSCAMVYGENDVLGRFKLHPFEDPQPGCDVQLMASSRKSVDYIDVSTMESLELGLNVTVFGHPVGLPLTLSKGIVSAEKNTDGLFQLSAPISPGSSGSPVLSDNGFLVGMATGSMDGQNLNFATGVDCLQGYVGFAREKEVVGEYHLADGGSGMGLEVTSIRQLPNYTELNLRTLSLNLAFDSTIFWYEDSYLLDSGTGARYDLVDSDLPTERANAVQVGLGDELRFTARFEKVPSVKNIALIDDFDSWNIEAIDTDADLDFAKIQDERNMKQAVMNYLSNEEIVNSIDEQSWERMNEVDVERAMLLGVRYYKAGDSDMAIAIFEAITKAIPERDAYVNLFEIYSLSEDDEDAAKALEVINRAVKLEPNSPDLLAMKLEAMMWNDLYNADLLEGAELLLEIDGEGYFDIDAHWARSGALYYMDMEQDERYCQSLRRVWYGNSPEYMKKFVEDQAGWCEW